MATRTKEGLELKLHVSFQYKLVKEQLPSLYSLAGLEYEALFTRIASNVILQKAGDYNAPQYWKNRSQIGRDFEVALNEALLVAHANCTGLMLLKIDLPDSYENAIEDTQVVIQELTTQQMIKNSTLIREEIEVERSAAFRDIDIINAEANSDALITMNNARATIISNTITQQAKAYAQVKKTIGTTTPKELLDYIFYLNINSLDKVNGNGKLIVDLGDSTVNLNQVGKGYGL